MGELCPKKNIRNVVFDIGGVLLDFCPVRILETLFPDQPDLRDQLRLIVFQSPGWLMMDRGILTREEFLERIAHAHPELREAARELLQTWEHHMPALPQGESAMDMANSRGLNTFLLTNYQAGPFETACHEHPFLRLTCGSLVSAHVHLLKPDPVIFRMMAHRFRLDVSETLFLDDSVPNVESAMLCGYQAAVVRNGCTLDTLCACL